MNEPRNRDKERYFRDFRQLDYCNEMKQNDVGKPCSTSGPHIKDTQDFICETLRDKSLGRILLKRILRTA
jgi:hypothetical protein